MEQKTTMVDLRIRTGRRKGKEEPDNLTDIECLYQTEQHKRLTDLHCVLLIKKMAMMAFLMALLSAFLTSACSQTMPVDCSDIYNSTQTVSGIYRIYPAGDFPVLVYCQMISYGNDDDNGGWTIKRISTVIYQEETEKMAIKKVLCSEEEIEKMAIKQISAVIY
ncbi:microfibril-associated glyco 4-like protein [Labeo rohita]|uniref:Microfibril-associated glyco 4-like protein n=1 Tax=Labeo rohita TaxID=84645 RepID=A0A498NL42_LABRO|nr:microfibril-associated glyco 4-like protein [Labeo rohita]